jgi:SAM-dependent methyltransferase
MPADWRIRAIGFDTFVAQVLVPLEQSKVPQRILDLGAGNSWLSNRLAQRGHAVWAVDLATNDFDGLGAYRKYDTVFTPVQAEFDRLPFPDAAVDLLIFNASLHYSVELRATLAEALRVLAPAGSLVILDSPVYQDAASGAQMVRERESQFQERFGFPSNALPSENYLTYGRLNELAAALHLRWQILTPFYDLRWTLKPLVARLLGRREPAKFHLIVGKRV